MGNDLMAIQDTGTGNGNDDYDCSGDDDDNDIRKMRTGLAKYNNFLRRTFIDIPEFPKEGGS